MTLERPEEQRKQTERMYVAQEGTAPAEKETTESPAVNPAAAPEQNMGQAPVDTDVV